MEGSVPFCKCAWLTVCLCGDPFQSVFKPKDESERNVCLQRAPFALRSSRLFRAQIERNCGGALLCSQRRQA